MTEAPAAHIAAPPEAQIAEILLSQLASRLTHLFATLQLADHLSDGPKTAEDLALVTDTHAPTLYRILRTMASLGFVTESADHRYDPGALPARDAVRWPPVARGDGVARGRCATPWQVARTW